LSEVPCVDPGKSLSQTNAIKPSMPSTEILMIAVSVRRVAADDRTTRGSSLIRFIARECWNRLSVPRDPIADLCYVLLVPAIAEHRSTVTWLHGSGITTPCTGVERYRANRNSGSRLVDGARPESPISPNTPNQPHFEKSSSRSVTVRSSARLPEGWGCRLGCSAQTVGPLACRGTAYAV
jgi:hypothetical protein